MKRYAFIYNPAARDGNSVSKIETLQKRIKQLPGAQLFHSQTKGDIPELVCRLLDDYDVFVACGGDGTIREVASSLIRTEKTMGIIPMGTGNDYGKTLGIPTDVRRSFELVVNGTPTEVDVGRCNDFIFLNCLGFGFDGRTNRYAHEIKKLPSLLRYVIAALKSAVKQNSFDVEIKQGGQRFHRQVIMITVANGRVEGGAFCIAPDASLTDGRFNLITIDEVRKWLIPLLLPLFLVKKGDWIPYVRSSLTREITLRFNDPVEIHADGEIIDNNCNEYKISLIPKGLKVISGL